MQQVESNNAYILPLKIALIFDCQTTPDAHYVGLYAFFLAEYHYGNREVCLILSPLGIESQQDADEHNAFFEFVLSVYSKLLHNLVALIAENCSTNQSIARRFKLLLVRCASHTYQSSGQQGMSNDNDASEAVRRLMKKLRTPSMRARFRSKTDLKGKLNNETRWTSKNRMLERHVELSPILSNIPDAPLDEFLLSR